MHARPTAWQSVALAVAVLASLVAGVVIARADAAPSPAPDAPVAPVVGGDRAPTVQDADGGDRDVADAPVTGADETLDTGASRTVTVTYTIERGGEAEIRTRTLAAAEDAEQLVDELRTRPQVAAAEVDAVYAALGDPQRPRQWGLDVLEAERLWADGHACGQVIGVIDSGVHAEHPDLRGVVQPGKNLIGRGTAMTDRSGHGTQVTGVAAAAHDNGVGISGLAPGVRVMPLAIEDAVGQMHASDLARAIKYAIEKHVDVLNLSLGGPERSPNVEYWLERAVDAGIPVIASAGNAAQHDNPTMWPAASPHTIAVGAIAPTGVWATFSTTGAYVDVVAPGVAVLTTSGRDGYAAVNGTSLSAPFVSATTAVLLAREPELDPAGIREILIATAEDLGPEGWDARFGHGLVDPVAALERVGGQARKCFTDIGALTLADQIERLAFAGVTDGCAPGKYCPAAPVTRGQMATFLSRALGQPSTDADYFDDDDVSIHEDGINRLAVAGIARGCTGTEFCPRDPVTRAQMAAFISRALDLPAAGVDVFDDDDGDLHEAAINALAARDITSGCDPARPELFCPHETVNRAQMAAFLVRMLDQ